MANLDLKGPLNLMGNLTLKSSGGKVTIGGVEILVETVPGSSQGTAPPVILPPPPSPPSDPGPNVAIINSFNKTVKIGNAAAVAMGMAFQSNTWPGMMLPSQGNTTPVTAGGLPINVVGDQAIIFPSGGSANFNTSGQ